MTDRRLARKRLAASIDINYVPAYILRLRKLVIIKVIRIARGKNIKESNEVPLQEVGCGVLFFQRCNFFNILFDFVKRAISSVSDWIIKTAFKFSQEPLKPNFSEKHLKTYETFKGEEKCQWFGKFPIESYTI